MPHYNFLAIALTALVPMIVGFIYYHPKVMGGPWMKANGFTLEGMVPPKPVMFLVSLIASFFVSLYMANNVTGGGGMDPNQVTDAKDGHSYVTFVHGMFHGIALAVTIILPIFITSSIFEKRGWTWTFVNWGYWLITIAIMGGILSAWR